MSAEETSEHGDAGIFGSLPTARHKKRKKK